MDVHATAKYNFITMFQPHKPMVIRTTHMLTCTHTYILYWDCTNDMSPIHTDM